MHSVDEARALLRGVVTPIGETEEVALAVASGRWLVDAVVADRDDPPFDKALMDGYALRAAETPGTLRQTARIEAGQDAIDPIEPGTCAWINTGGPVPPGADAVARVEWTHEGDAGIEIDRAVPRGEAVLPRADLVRAGDELCSGRLDPERIAVCASAGLDPVRVLRRPVVAVIATGNELAATPGPHDIRNSNGPLLVSLLQPYADVVDLGVVGDEIEATRAAFEIGLAYDVLVTTGGVSRGDLDLVRPALESLGGEVLLHGVALQPGKPFLCARRGDSFAFGLPGNPASALVCADLFVLPFLVALQGGSFDATPARREGVLSAPVKASAQRRRVFPCVREGDRIHPLPFRSSADLYTLPRANAYLVIEPGVDLAEGARATCLVPERFAAR